MKTTKAIYGAAAIKTIIVLSAALLAASALAQQPLLRMPVPDGHRTYCTNGNHEGPGGTHNGPSGEYAIDFDDQPNTPGRIVVASAAGTAYVRTEAQGGSWGRNVRIDHGNGYYTLYAHLASTTVAQGQGVAQGQQIGVIGGSGGWPVHLHFGLHQGNANGTAISGSVRADNIWARDVTTGGAFRWMTSEEFVGGLPTGGHVYEGGTPPPPGVAPTIELYNLPPDNRYYRTNESLPWRVTAGTAPWNVWEVINGGDVAGPYQGQSGHVNLQVGGTGWKECWARVQNAFGSHSSPQHWHGGYDNQNPSATRSGGAVTAPSWNTAATPAIWTASDVGAGPKRLRFRWDGGTWSDWQWNTGSGRELPPFGGNAPLIEGQHVLQVEVEDNSWTGGGQNGNGSISTIGTFWLDSQMPSSTMNIVGTLGENGWYVSQPSVSLLPTDPPPSSGVAAWYTLNGGTATQYSVPFQITQNGNNALTYYAKDVAGNQEAAHEVAVKVDTTPPPAPTLQDEGEVTSSNTVLNVDIVAGTDPDSGLWAIEYSVGDGIDPEAFRPITRNYTLLPYLHISGLFMPTGQTAFVRVRTVNQAGLVGPWATTNGILIDPNSVPFHQLTHIFGSFGNFSTHPDIHMGATAGETVIDVSTHHDVDLAAGFWWALPAPEDVYPEVYAVNPGQLVSGNLASLLQSDDDRMVLRPGIVISSSLPPIALTVSATAPVDNATEIKVIVESHASAGNIRQDIEMYDFDAGAWVVIDSRTTPIGSDGTIIVTLTGNLARFFEDGTNTIRSRVRYKATGPVLSYPYQTWVDQVKWVVQR